MQLGVPSDWLAGSLPEGNNCTYFGGATAEASSCEICQAPIKKLVQLKADTEFSRIIKINVCSGECAGEDHGWITEVSYPSPETTEEKPKAFSSGLSFETNWNTSSFGGTSSGAWNFDDNKLDNLLNMDNLFSDPSEVSSSLPKKKNEKPSVPENEFRGFYVAFEEEPKSNACDETKIKTLIENYNKSKQHSEEQWVGQEEEIERGLDLVTNFHSRVGRCSDQLIRYMWKGVPLFFDKKVNPPLCRTCGATTSFEFQLMPHILNILEPEQESLDFLTVFGYSCENCDEVHLVIHREEPLNIELTKQQKNVTQNENVIIKTNKKKKKKIAKQQQTPAIIKEGDKKVDTKAIHSLMDSFMLGKAKNNSVEMRI